MSVAPQDNARCCDTMVAELAVFRKKEVACGEDNKVPQPGQPLPHTFAEALVWIEGRICADFDREIAQKQLYYHNRDHINAVRRRVSQPFYAIRPSM